MESLSIKESDCPQSWILTSEVIREECLKRTGLTYDKWVGEIPCNCSTANKANAFQGIPEIGKYWDNLTSTAPIWWKMPDGLLWI
jgi:hypothetical protein